jgi:hypothetical protein
MRAPPPARGTGQMSEMLPVRTTSPSTNTLMAAAHIISALPVAEREVAARPGSPLSAQEARGGHAGQTVTSPRQVGALVQAAQPRSQAPPEPLRAAALGLLRLLEALQPVGLLAHLPLVVSVVTVIMAMVCCGHSKCGQGECTCAVRRMSTRLRRLSELRTLSWWPVVAWCSIWRKMPCNSSIGPASIGVCLPG